MVIVEDPEEEHGHHRTDTGKACWTNYGPGLLLAAALGTSRIARRIAACQSATYAEVTGNRRFRRSGMVFDLDLNRMKDGASQFATFHPKQRTAMRPAWSKWNWWSSKAQDSRARWAARVHADWIRFREGRRWLSRAWWKAKPGQAWSWLSRPLGASGRWLSTWWHPPDNLLGLLETEEWVYGYASPREDEDGAYSLAMEYASKRYEEIAKIAEALDRKLDDLGRTALTIGTIVATVARIAGFPGGLMRSPLMIGAIALSALTVIVGSVSRRPTQSRMPMNPRTLLEVVDLPARLPKSKIEGVAAASYHYALIGMTFVTEWKAKQLKRATWLFCLSLVLIVALLALTPNAGPQAFLHDGVSRPPLADAAPAQPR
jgi:hypothetical protein